MLRCSCTLAYSSLGVCVQIAALDAKVMLTSVIHKVAAKVSGTHCAVLCWRVMPVAHVCSPAAHSLDYLDLKMLVLLCVCSLGSRVNNVARPTNLAPRPFMIALEA
jgi:hypothetical protein